MHIQPHEQKLWTSGAPWDLTTISTIRLPQGTLPLRTGPGLTPGAAAPEDGSRPQRQPRIKDNALISGVTCPPAWAHRLTANQVSHHLGAGRHQTKSLILFQFRLEETQEQIRLKVAPRNQLFNNLFMSQ